MKKIFLSITLIIFTFNIGVTQTKIAGVDTISEPYLHYFLNNLNHLIAHDDSSINKFKNMFYQDTPLCFVGNKALGNCIETVETMTETIYNLMLPLTTEGTITFKVRMKRFYHNPEYVKYNYAEYAGIYSIILSNEKLGQHHEIQVCFGRPSPTTILIKSLVYWEDYAVTFHGLIIDRVDGTTDDLSDYSKF